MRNSQFKKEYIFTFKKEDTPYRKALEIFCLYYLETEIFDCLLTNNFDADGVAIIPFFKKSISNKFAIEKYNKLIYHKGLFMIDDESFLDAKRYFRNMKLNVKNLKEQYKTITGKDYENIFYS